MNLATMDLQGILLDKDGTLIDFDATWGPATFEAMRVLSDGDRGKLEALMRISHYVEPERRILPSSPLVAGSSADYGPSWAQVLGRVSGPSFFREMDELFALWGLKSLAPIHDPAAILAGLKRQGFRLGVATNDSETSAVAQSKALGLGPYLDFIAGYDSGFGGKPDPGMVLGFAAACGLVPAAVALVGDSLHDLHAARAAGSVAIAVLTGPLGEASRADLEPHADYVIGSIADLPTLAETLRAKASPSADAIS
jgi:phosphoglycolate phosphatase